MAQGNADRRNDARAKAKLEVRCLVVPGCTEDMSARYAYLDSIGVARKDVVELQYFDHARSKYKALGMPDTMPPSRPHIDETEAKEGS